MCILPKGVGVNKIPAPDWLHHHHRDTNKHCPALYTLWQMPSQSQVEPVDVIHYYWINI